MSRAEYLRQYRSAHMNLRAAERLDVLEEPAPPKGCNARVEGGRCRRRIVSVTEGPFGWRRLCAEHRRAYLAHDRVIARIAGVSPLQAGSLWKSPRPLAIFEREE
jgi:hypothetical protein